MARRKILIIDDDLFWPKLLKRLFGENYDMQTAASCTEGVRVAREQKPDCILLDFHLDDGDAVEVCSELRNGGQELPAPVVVVSSDPCAEVTAYAECRAAYFVLKGSPIVMKLPVIVEELLSNDGTLSCGKAPDAEPSC